MSYIDHGEIVQIETSSSPPTPNNYIDIISQRFTDTFGIASQMLTLMIGNDGQSGFMGAIKDAIIPPPTPDIDYTAVDVSFSPASIGTAPTFSGTLSDYPEETFTPPSLLPLPNVDLSAAEPPVKPDLVNAVLSWSEGTLPTTVFTDLLALLSAWTTGIDPTEEQAMYDRAKNRQQADNAARYAKLNNDLIARGMQGASGALVDALIEFSNVATRQDADIENNIIVIQADNARKHSEFKLSQMVNLEGLIRQSYDGAQARALDYAKAIAENTRANVKTAVEMYLAESEANKAYILVQVENLKAAVEHNRGLVDMFRGQNEGYKTRSEAIAARNKGITDVFVAEMQGFAEGARAISSENQTTIQAVLAKLQNGELELRKSVAIADAILKAYGTEAQLKEKVVSDMASLCAQSLASALGSVNASASVGYSSGESKSENWSQSKQLSEHHGYEHDPES